MSSIKAHFDGTSIVLDEPAMLTVGQAVRVITLGPSFTQYGESTTALMRDEAFDERDALHIDPLDAVPANFVRVPGSGAGEIKMAADFEQTPDEFKEYL